MNRIAPILPAEAGADDARVSLEQHPTIARYLEGLSRSNRSRLRVRLATRYMPEVVEVLLPRVIPVRLEAPDGPWGAVSGPARVSIGDAFGFGPNALPADPEFWTPENAAKAADAVAARYSNPSSATVALSALRLAFDMIHAGRESAKAVREATLRPELTKQHNTKIAASRSERVAAGIVAPEPYLRVADLVARVQAFVSGASPLTTQTAADFLVAFSARPGEAERLDLGPRGGITGMLKKRGLADEMPLVSALGEDLARSFIEKWKAAPAASRSAAVRDIGQLAASWGLQRRDLRAIGAALAVRAAVLDGVANNTGQERDVMRAALRHEPGRRIEAVDHYARVNTGPAAAVAAQVAEMSPDDLAALTAWLAARRT